MEVPKAPVQSQKEKEWLLFAERVRKHIVEYVVPQYGDYPDPNLADLSMEERAKAINKYVARVGKNARGREEQIRDFLKMAHYACYALVKYEEGEKS